MPFSLGMAMPGNADVSESILVSWWVPGAEPSAALKPGTNAKVIDLFGPWERYDGVTVASASAIEVPPVEVPREEILLMNVELDADKQIPFEVLDTLNKECGIDCTAMSLSLTHRGNLYRAHVLQRPADC